MKKILSIILVIMMLGVYSTAVEATLSEETYETNFTYSSLIIDWEKNGYPDYITYIYHSGSWNETGNEGNAVLTYETWEIGLYNATQNDIDYIVSLFPNNYEITFKECSVNYASRHKIVNEINALKDEHIKYVMIMNNSEQIVVLVDKLSLNKYSEILPEKYGEIISVEEFSEDNVRAEGLYTNVIYVSFFMVAVILAFVLIYYLKRRHSSSQNTQP